ncbi:MAG TPA: aminodeoxychorismate lyase [Steroidobacteraceae bacterium]|jgi:4-amino-4-deoxychorismate lyase|nr:aminodeoxychorismate lyase [Steroidobacteraceae bacterium]
MNTDPLVALVDGQPATALSVLDRGLHYGDGLFETIACRDARPTFLELHLQRLAEGCARLSIRYEDFPGLAARIGELAATQPRSIIKLILTRGSATARGYGARGDERAHTVLLQYRWAPEDPQLWEHGVVVRTAVGRLGENPLLAGLKHLNRLEQVLIRAEWTDPLIQEALLFSSSGWLVSGTMSNVFLVTDGRLMTPAITHAGIRGVMRRVVINAAQSGGVAVTQTTLDAAALAAAEEIFLTNARIGIWPVRVLDGRALARGPVTRQLQQWLRPLLEAPHA